MTAASMRHQISSRAHWEAAPLPAILIVISPFAVLSICWCKCVLSLFLLSFLWLLVARGHGSEGCSWPASSRAVVELRWCILPIFIWYHCNSWPFTCINHTHLPHATPAWCRRWLAVEVEQAAECSMRCA